MAGHPAGIFFFQEAYRVRDDTAGENEDAGWIAASNTPWVQPTNENFRIRYLVRLQSRPGNNTSGFFDLYYSHNGGPFTYLDNSDEVFTTDPILYAIDSNVTEYVHGDDATNLLGGSDVFLTDNNGIVERQGYSDSCTFPPSSVDTIAEVEFCLTLRDEFVSNGDEITLRVFFNDIVFAGGYTEEATFTVARSIIRGNVTTTTARFTENLELEHTVALGADGALIVLLGISDGAPAGFIPESEFYASTVTYSGGPLTFTGSVQARGTREDPYIAAYILTGPTTTGTIPLTIAAGAEVNDLFVAVIDYHNVNQSDPILTVAAASTADPNFQLGGVGLQPTTTGYGITACLCAEANGLHVGGSGQAELFNEQEGNSRFSGFDKRIPGSGYFPMTVTNLADYTSVSLSVALRPA